MTPEQKTQKQLAVVSAVIDMAVAMTKAAKEAYPRKRIFRPVDRTPGKRYKKNKARLKLISASWLGMAQVHRIISTPVPRKEWKSGGVVGEGGPELIMNKECELILPLKPEMTYLPKDATVKK